MGTYIGVRLLHALIVLALVTVLVFVIAQLIPGDAIMATMAGSVDLSDPAVVAKVRQQFGLHRPILGQFAVWLAHFVRGDWGTSIGTGEKLLDMFLRRLPVTLELFLGASLWSLAIGIPTGVGALKRNSAIDMLLTACSIIDVSIPSFWPSAMPSPSRCWCMGSRPRAIAVPGRPSCSRSSASIPACSVAIRMSSVAASANVSASRERLPARRVASVGKWQADCPRKRAAGLADPFGAGCPDLRRVFRSAGA